MTTGKHTATCATGARAEKRGACDCGADTSQPFRFRLMDQVEPQHELAGRPYPYIPHRMVELVIDGPLTTRQVCDLALALLELTRVEAARAAAMDARRRIKTPRVWTIPDVGVDMATEPSRSAEAVVAVENGVVVDVRDVAVDDDVDTSPCPGCGHWIPTGDLGVLAHPRSGTGGCGYCSHPAMDRKASSDWWVCGICGAKRRDDGQEIPSFVEMSSPKKCAGHDTGWCDLDPTFAVFTPNGERSPGNVCINHGPQMVDDYRDKLGEEWHLVPIWGPL